MCIRDRYYHLDALQGTYTITTREVCTELTQAVKMCIRDRVRKGRVTIEEAAEDAGMTVEEFKKGMENTSLQAV